MNKKPDIENLKVWMSGRSTTGYQRALGMREFENLLSYVSELEQLRQPLLSGTLNSNCEYILTAEQGHRTIKCIKCGDVKPI